MVRKMLLSWIATFTLLHTTLIHGKEISVDNGGPWGVWGDLENCPPGTVATGFALKIEGPQGKGDDTALNAIKLLCTKPCERIIQREIISLAGRWGSWIDIQWCPSGVLSSFALQVEQPIGKGDDTAANNIKFQCSNDNILTGNGGRWGTFSNWSDRCQSGICGIKTKVEPEQGRGDDTALNNVMFSCC
ncbi:vitelline membrane outer layer protein 1-like [Lithobates pipiens]